MAASQQKEANIMLDHEGLCPLVGSVKQDPEDFLPYQGQDTVFLGLVLPFIPTPKVFPSYSQDTKLAQEIVLMSEVPASFHFHLR